MRRVMRVVTGVCAAVAVVLSGLSVSAPPASAAVITKSFGVGSAALATPSAGGRYIYVSPSGADRVYPPSGATYSNGAAWPSYTRVSCLEGKKLPSWVATAGWSAAQSCPEPSIQRPLRTVQAAVLVARPGDVIVVRAGSYSERVGYAARAATAAEPIVLQNQPGERVEIRGWLNLKGADYWQVVGLRFIYDAAVTGSAQAVVAIFGGTGWVFANNEVRETRGVANLLVSAESTTSTSSAAKTAAAPHDYSIIGNCIRDQRGSTGTGMDHNIYLMPTIWSSGGLVAHNLISGAPNGGNIKAAGSKDPNGSPVDVRIHRNTLLNAASGVIVGQKAAKIEITRNVIGLPLKSDRTSGGVKSYDIRTPTKIGIKDNVISGYAQTISEPYGSTSHMFLRRTTVWPVSYTGSIAGCSVTLKDANISAKWGHRSS